MATKQATPPADPLAEAITYEAQIAAEAAGIRKGKSELTAELFLELYPLLCRPIPAGFIQTIGVTKGKPYESTGIRSVQVQIDRMNNVLTPLWWRDEVEYEDGGKLATVTVIVGDGQRPDLEPLVVRKSRGGVGQGSGVGNIYKGSYTNAAKLAFARLGPGHEVYLGAADLDPDVNQAIADQAAAGNGDSDTRNRSTAKIGLDIAGTILDAAEDVPTAKANLRLAVSHTLGKDIGELDDRELALGALAENLTFSQAEEVQRWVQRKASEAEAEVADGGGSGA